VNELLFFSYIERDGVGGVLVEMGQILLNDFAKPFGG